MQAANLWSLEWLVKIAPSVRLKEVLGTSLRGAGVLQRFLRTTALIPGAPHHLAFVLRCLEFQNPTLRTGSWRVHQGNKEDEKWPAKAGWILISGIPLGAAGPLKALELRPYLG